MNILWKLFILLFSAGDLLAAVPPSAGVAAKIVGDGEMLSVSRSAMRQAQTEHRHGACRVNCVRVTGIGQDGSGGLMPQSVLTVRGRFVWSDDSYLFDGFRSIGDAAAEMAAMTDRDRFRIVANEHFTAYYSLVGNSINIVGREVTERSFAESNSNASDIAVSADFRPATVLLYPYDWFGMLGGEGGKLLRRPVATVNVRVEGRTVTVEQQCRAGGMEWVRHMAADLDRGGRLVSYEHQPDHSPVGYRIGLTWSETADGRIFLRRLDSVSTTPQRDPATSMVIEYEGVSFEPVSGTSFDLEALRPEDGTQVHDERTGERYVYGDSGDAERLEETLGKLAEEVRLDGFAEEPQ